MLLSLFTVTAKKFLDRSVSQVINKLKYGNKIITIGVALPVAFCLHQSFLDINIVSWILTCRKMNFLKLGQPVLPESWESKFYVFP